MGERWEEVWRFNTARYSVVLSVTDESDDPEGHFATGDDAQDAEAVAFCRQGGWHWFQARVQVWFRDDVIGEDYLGGCSYHGLSDFKRGGYFRDMVCSAVGEAREKLGGNGAVSTRIPTSEDRETIERLVREIGYDAVASYLNDLAADPAMDDAGSTCVHEWAFTGSAYGGDDDRWRGEGRVYCVHCGADGDA